MASNPGARTVSQDTLSATPTLGDQPAQVVINIRRLTLSTPALSPTQVIGGGLSTATVTLSDPAPARGAVLGLVVNGRLRYEDAQGNVITSLNVPAGARNATFRVRPEGVLLSTNVPVTVTEPVSGTSFSSTLNVLALRLQRGRRPPAHDRRQWLPLQRHAEPQRSRPAGGRRRQSARLAGHRGLPQRRGAGRERRRLPRRGADGRVPGHHALSGVQRDPDGDHRGGDGRLRVYRARRSSRSGARPSRPRRRTRTRRRRSRSGGRRSSWRRPSRRSRSPSQRSPGSAPRSASRPLRRRPRRPQAMHPRARRPRRRRKGGPSSRLRDGTVARRPPSAALSEPLPEPAPEPPEVPPAPPAARGACYAPRPGLARAGVRQRPRQRRPRRNRKPRGPARAGARRAPPTAALRRRETPPAPEAPAEAPEAPAPTEGGRARRRRRTT